MSSASRSIFLRGQFSSCPFQSRDSKGRSLSLDEIAPLGKDRSHKVIFAITLLGLTIKILALYLQRCPCVDGVSYSLENAMEVEPIVTLSLANVQSCFQKSRATGREQEGFQLTKLGLHTSWLVSRTLWDKVETWFS